MDDTRDYGTPKKDSATMVTLTIDGQKISVPQGTSIMRAASELGSSIPKLCATDSLEPFGSCRLCLVEIEGRRGYPHHVLPQLMKVWLYRPKHLNLQISEKV